MHKNFVMPLLAIKTRYEMRFVDYFRMEKNIWMGLILCFLSLSVSVDAKELALPLIKVVVKDERQAGPQLRYFNQLDQAGILLLDQQMNPLQSKASQQFFIPASTTKLITALLALRHWGADYQFKTTFYLTEQDQPTLLVKGYGDPFLVSEELAMIAQQLAKRLKHQGITSLAGIELDTSYYQTDLKMPGAGRSDNPYDAIPSALAANFNTIYIRKTAEGFESAEPQTPITKTALKLAKQIRTFKKTSLGRVQRVNLGADERLSQTYFAELLAAFLRLEGLNISEKVEWSVLSEQPRPASLIYEHRNHLTLDEMIRPMMKYSTNFVANQLALNLSQEVMGGAASAEKVAQTYHQLLTELFDWQEFTIEEGAGLSRQNRLSPEQLIEVLTAFQPWRHLLPEIERDVYAKSGSLLGVSTLAGYLHKESQWYPFAFMINQKVPYRYRNKLAKELSDRY